MSVVHAGPLGRQLGGARTNHQSPVTLSSKNTELDQHAVPDWQLHQKWHAETTQMQLTYNM